VAAPGCFAVLQKKPGVTTFLPLFPWQLWIAIALNVVMNALQVGAYGARYAGVMTRRVAIALSLFSVVVIATRMANLLYAPLFSSLQDRARSIVATPHIPAAIAEDVIHGFETQARLVLLAAALGVAIGIWLLPTFAVLFIKGTRSFEETRSVAVSLSRLFRPHNLALTIESLRAFRFSLAKQANAALIPRRILVLNAVVVAANTVGVVSATIAGLYAPQAAVTAAYLSGLITGIGTLAATFFVDPFSALVVDEAVSGKRTLADVKSVVAWLALTMFLGTLLSQILLLPGASLIALVARTIRG
jgi:hypothetical protein